VRAPAVAFGTGGSGTRAVAAIMREAGIYLGPRLNKSLDALVLRDFIRPAIDPYLERTRWVARILEEPGARLEAPPAELLGELAATAELQREGIPDLAGAWGWKAPRSIWLFPLIAHAFPEAVTIQLVRDGRHMAYSRNQQQAEAYRARIAPELAAGPAPVAAAAVWARGNVAAARYGGANLGERHLVVRYEDLCAQPQEWAARILEHLGAGVSGELVERAAAHVDPAASSGREADRDPGELAAVERAAAAGLREFGYLGPLAGA
jgi:hypothetical protein